MLQKLYKSTRQEQDKSSNTKNRAQQHKKKTAKVEEG